MLFCKSIETEESGEEIMTGDEPNDLDSHDPKTHDRRFHGQPQRIQLKHMDLYRFRL